MRKLLWSVVLCSILLPGRALGACHVVTPSGSGNHTGADWNNAYKGFGTGTGQLNPASMVRGDTYYLGAGSYGQVTFNAADSGTALITVKAATTADNCTSTGWNAGTMQGSAIFSSSGNTSAISVNSDYWTFDGNYGAGGTVAGGDITPSDYGIQAIWGSGTINSQIIAIGSSGGPYASNITFRHVGESGSNGAPGYDGTSSDVGIKIQPGASSPNYLLEYDIFMDNCAHLVVAGVSNLTVQYSVGMTNFSIGAGCHGENVRFANGANNLTFRYNQWRSGAGTAVFGQPCGTCSPSSNVYIYGERIYWVSSDQCSIGGGSFGQCVLGDGIVWSSAGTGVTGNFYFINNTIDGLTSAVMNVGSFTIPYNSGSTTWGTVLIQDNIISNSIPVSAPACPASCTSYTWNYHAYYNTTNTADTDTNKQVFSSSPFMAESSQNFQLSGDTLSGVSFSSPYNQDSDGNTRGADGTWDRGAFQYALGPNAPTNLQATVN